MTMGEKILNMRKARGWSQEELADRVGVTRQAVSRWESGSAKPDADKIIAVCDLFGVSADYLLRDSYNGETGQIIRTERKESELGKFFRGMSLKQWAGFVLVTLSAVIMFVLFMFYMCSDQSYSYTIYEENEPYTYWGFRAFLYVERICLLWLFTQCAMAAGVILMLWNRIQKIIRDNK